MVRRCIFVKSRDRLDDTFCGNGVEMTCCCGRSQRGGEGELRDGERKILAVVRRWRFFKGLDSKYGLRWNCDIGVFG